MIIPWLFAIAFVLFAMSFRETYQDPESPVTRPSMESGAWRSKIDAEAPIQGNDEDYMRVLQAFHDNVWVPSATKPRDTDVETFLKSSAAQVPNVDPVALRKMIASGFRIEKTISSAAREEAQIKFQPSKALEPDKAVDEVRTRTEQIYVPADPRLGDLPEGLYAPVSQTKPHNTGDYGLDAPIFQVCDPSKDLSCAENVL